MSELIKTSTIQYCPTLKFDVTMKIEGVRHGAVIEGKVIDCDLANCSFRGTNKCWIGLKIMTVA